MQNWPFGVGKDGNRQDGTPRQESEAQKNADIDAAGQTQADQAQLQAMSERLYDVLRMAVMGALREENGGFVLEAGDKRLRMPQARSLFEAYLTLTQTYGGDWRAIGAEIDGPWTRKAVEMALSPREYIGVWRALRMRIIAEALPALKAHGAQAEETRDPKFFTLVALETCDKVIGLLGQSEREPENP